MNTSAEAHRKDLMEQIAEEERRIRIYQAELALQRSTSTTRLLVQDLEEQDWLETLDALQSCKSLKMESRAQDDPAIHRLMPLVGGVSFTSVRALTSDDGSTMRSYQFQGTVQPQVFFAVTAKVKLLESEAKVVSLEVKFGDQSNELEKIANVAAETCCIPLLFRHLRRWSEFDSRRTFLLLEYQAKHADAIQRLSKEVFGIQIMNANNVALCSLHLVWEWKCNRFERGKEELRLQACNVSPEMTMNQVELVQCVREIQKPEGLVNLVESTASCEKAIHLLVQVLLGQ